MAKEKIKEKIKKRILSKDDNVIHIDGPNELSKQNKEILIKRKNISKFKIIGVVLIAIISVGIYLYLNNIEYKGYKIIKQNKSNYENTAQYVQYASNLLKYTPDGVSYINENGDTVWTAGIDMKVPIVVVSDDYAVVADLRGNSVYIFGVEGQESHLTMQYPICDIDIGSQGAFAVVLESDKNNYINLYNKKGEIIYEIQTTIDKSGYPLDISISEDGKKLFTSYLFMQGTEMKINLAAYNFGDVGQNTNADRLMGGYIFDDEIFPKVDFLTNDIIAAFSDKSIILYAMKEKPSQKAIIKIDKEILSIFYNEDYVGYVTKNNSKDSKNKYIMYVYNTNGGLKFSKEFNVSYDNIYASKNEIIVTGGTDCLIIKKTGAIKFNQSLGKKIISMVPNGHRNEYVVVFDTNTEIIKLKISNYSNKEDEKSTSNKGTKSEDEINATESEVTSTEDTRQTNTNDETTQLTPTEQQSSTVEQEQTEQEIPTEEQVQTEQQTPTEEQVQTEEEVATEQQTPTEEQMQAE